MGLVKETFMDKPFAQFKGLGGDMEPISIADWWQVSSQKTIHARRQSELKMAFVNNLQRDEDYLLHDGDRVALFSPVAGG
jgi:hypothetical protein